MKPGRLVCTVSACAMLLAGVTPALAENWVDTRHALLIDVDSIHRESDGLTYYLVKRKYSSDDDQPRAQKAAVDCAARLAYSSYSIEYQPDWRAKGERVISGTMGEELLDFVCERAR